MTRCLFVVFVIAVFLAQSAMATGRIAIHNDSNQAWRVWFYVEAKKGWSQPEMFLARNAKDDIRLSEPGRYYLVLRDEARRDSHLGWINFHKLAQAKGAILQLSAIAESRTIEVPQTVMVPVQRTRTVIVNGMRVEQSYTVLVPQVQSKMLTMVVMVPKLEVRVGDKVLDLKDYRD